jgi:hypothetical protein
MPNNCRRDIHEDSLPADLVGPNIFANQATDSVQPPSFATIDKWSPQLANPHILIIRKGSSRSEQAAVDPVNFADLLHGKIVKWETGNDVVVALATWQMLYRRVNDPNLVAESVKPPVLVETPLEQGNKMAVDLD